MNFREEFMSPDDVELLIHVLPTPEENKKLLEYKDRVAELRDVHSPPPGGAPLASRRVACVLRASLPARSVMHSGASREGPLLWPFAKAQGQSRCWEGGLSYDSGLGGWWKGMRTAGRALRAALATRSAVCHAAPHVGAWFVRKSLEELQLGRMSGHRGSFRPSHAFDLLADAADRFFWYSKQATEGHWAWLGLEVFRAVQVRCVELFHNNLPEVPVALQSWQDHDWSLVQRWPAAAGGQWTYLLVDEAQTRWGTARAAPASAAASAVEGSKSMVELFALSHQGTYSGIKVRCEVLKDAAKQVRKSEEFRQMLSVVLRVGNFINHGVDEEEVKTQEVDGATIRGISVDSLSSLASFKSGTVSTMHFLCLSLGSMNTDFFQGLKESLSSVQEASKEKSALLKGSIESFAKDVETAEKQLNLLLTVDEEAAEFAPSEEKEAELREEMEKWKEESDVLQKIGDEDAWAAFNECAVAQKFFSASERKQAELPPVESFFLHIANFLEQFQEAWTEIERNPRKWAEMAPKDEKGHTRMALSLWSFPFLSIRQQRKSLPAAVTHSSSEGGRETSTAESGPSGAVRVRKCASQARVPRQSAPNLAQPNLAQRLSLSGFDVDSTAHKAPATSSKQELEHAGAQEKSQASEQDTLEKEKEAKEVCGSVRRSIYASVAQKMSFHLERDEQHGDRCRGNSSWTCPAGCVATGPADYPSFHCCSLSNFRCAGPCRAEHGCLGPGRYALPMMQTNAANASDCQRRCTELDGCSLITFWPLPGDCHLHPSGAPFHKDTAGASLCGPGRCEGAESSSSPPSNHHLVPSWALPLRVVGSRLVGQDQQSYQLACVNWYGAHMEMLVNDGVNAFNCVRLPYSLDSLNLSAAEIPQRFSSLCHNPELQAATPLEIFDATVEALTDAGLLIVLNHHVFHRGWCCSADDGEGLWYTEDYQDCASGVVHLLFEESTWLQHLSFMATRYRANARVVGLDLKNEIRSTEEITPSWGTGDLTSDWARAARLGTQRVLQADPEMLVVISGLETLGSDSAADAADAVPRDDGGQSRAFEASALFLASMLMGLLGALGVLALVAWRPRLSSKVACPRAARACGRPFRCRLVTQVAAAASDFWAAVFFFLLWLPGLVLSLRLPLLLLLQLWPVEDSDKGSKAPLSPSSTGEMKKTVRYCEDVEMADLNERGPVSVPCRAEGVWDWRRRTTWIGPPHPAGPPCRPKTT
eukprot:g24734.t1